MSDKIDWPHHAAIEQACARMQALGIRPPADVNYTKAFFDHGFVIVSHRWPDGSSASGMWCSKVKWQQVKDALEIV